MWQWAGHVLGLDDGAGPWYLFWSGFGANFGELTLLAALWAMFRKHNCEQNRCWRVSRHQWLDPERGTAHTLCRRHHPHGAPTASHIERVTKEGQR